MKQWHLRYYYLATGMEGVADEEDLGLWAADSAGQAKEHYLDAAYPRVGPTRDFVRGCLSATEVTGDG